MLIYNTTEMLIDGGSSGEVGEDVSSVLALNL